IAKRGDSRAGLDRMPCSEPRPTAGNGRLVSIAGGPGLTREFSIVLRPRLQIYCRRRNATILNDRARGVSRGERFKRLRSDLFGGNRRCRFPETRSPFHGSAPRWEARTRAVFGPAQSGVAGGRAGPTGLWRL